MEVTVPLAVMLLLAAAFGASAVLNIVQRMHICNVLQGRGGECLRVDKNIDTAIAAPHPGTPQNSAECEGGCKGSYPREILSNEARAESIARAYRLTPRECEVLALLLEGHGTARIAEKMVVSASTVKSHTYNIYGKMGVHSHQEMIDACEALRGSGIRSEMPAAGSGRPPGKRRVLLGASRNVA